MYPAQRKIKFPAPLLADWMLRRLGYRAPERTAPFLRACMVHALSFLVTFGPFATAWALWMTDSTLLAAIGVTGGASLLYGAMVASAAPRGRR